jgi:hypothetical protein
VYSQPTEQVEPSRNKERRASERRDQTTPTINVTVTTPEKTAEEKQADTDRAKRQDDTNERIAQANDRMATFSFYLVVVGAIQLLAMFIAAGITLRAANAAKQSADTATQALHLTERADVTIESVQHEAIGGHMIADTQIAIAVMNRGRTRALSLSFSGNISVDDTIVHHKESAWAAIGSSGDASFPICNRLGDHVTPGTLADINAGTAKLSAAGTLTYQDIFKETHTIKFKGNWFSDLHEFRAEHYDTN